MADTSKTNDTIPAMGAFAITPSNTELDRAVRMVTIGTAGILVFRGVDGVNYTTGTLPVGNYPVAAVAILPATTATGLTGWY